MIVDRGSLHADNSDENRGFFNMIPMGARFARCSDSWRPAASRTPASDDDHHRHDDQAASVGEAWAAEFRPAGKL